MKNIAVIPARSGSKGLKDKNIKILNGKPLIAYTIEAALDSGVFDEVMVSTDSEKYASIAKKFGAAVPFLRSEELSADASSSWDAVKDVLIRYKNSGNDFDTVCLLQPTSPLRPAEDIKKAFSLFIQKDAKAVVSVCETDHSPLWCNTLPDSLSMDGFIKEESISPRQLLNKYYRINGAIYFTNIKHLFGFNTIYSNNCYAYVMDKLFSIDIDDETDFSLAEFLMRKLNITG